MDASPARLVGWAVRRGMGTSAVQYSTQPAINGLIILRSYDFSIRNCFSAAGLTLLRQIPCRRGYGPKHTYGITVCSEGAALAALVPLAVFFVVGFGWHGWHESGSHAWTSPTTRIPAPNVYVVLIAAETLLWLFALD